MTTEQIKEQLSIHYLGALVSRAGHLMKMPTGTPTGVDVSISEYQKIEISGKIRHIDTGNAIDIQLKCTARNKLPVSADAFEFDLETKNFNDLIWRRKYGIETKSNPLLLIVLILPMEQKKWLTLQTNELILEGFLTLGGVAYWYYPDVEGGFTANKKTKRIYISTGNKVDLEFVNDIFNHIKI